MKAGSLRRLVSLLLVASLLAPSLGVAQTPTTSQQPQPPGPTIRSTPTPPPAPSGPRGVTPGPDYRLAPGDLLDVQIAGRLEVIRQQAVVDLEGAINVPPLGAIPVAGLTLLEAHRKVAARARDVFRFAAATLTVVAPRTFEVTVSGEVDRPGTVQTAATRRVYDVILEAGGVTPRGSLRNITLARRSGERQIDLLAFQLRGDLAQNPFVEEGLRIHVPPRSGSVTLAGAVRRPGEYEIGSTPSLRELLDMVGGLSHAAALGDARLTRVVSGDRKEAMALDLRSALTPPADVMLRPGDTIYVPAISSLQDLVEVRGVFNGTAESTKTTVAGKSTILQRFDLAPREYVALAGGPTNRARLVNTLVTFRNGRTYVMADAPPLEPGAVVTVPEVAVKWWQDYVTILQAVASLVTAYTGLYFIFNNRAPGN